MGNIRVRFAPSPTGPLHIGGARSALFNYLWARKNQGQFIVRIEDTDLERSTLESEADILASLRWLGIDWDEGIEMGGPHAPYRQTERLDSYRNYASRLLEKGQAYYCYCTEEELEAERQALMACSEMPRYRGKCRSLSQAEAERLAAAGRKPVIRFRVPDNEEIIINDLVREQVVFDSNGIGDFVIVKSDGIPTYNFAVVIDDAQMEISHIIRGEEHLSNTPRQVLLYRALGLPEPEFAHVSLILGKDRSKMSKRHGATSIIQYQSRGYLPEALVNYLALLGWSPGGEEEIFSMEQLIEQFSLQRVAKNPAVFDLDKLNWLNGFYIRMKPVEELVVLALPYLIEAGIIAALPDERERTWVTRLTEAVYEHLSCMAEIVDHAHLFQANRVEPADDEAQQVLQEEQVPQVAELFRARLLETELNVDNVKALLKQLTKDLKLGGRKVYMPLRVLLTGQTHGPELYHIIPLLGQERVLTRLEHSLALKA